MFYEYEENQISQSQIDKFKNECSNFVELNNHIMNYTEEQILMAIYVEKTNKSRFNILNRLYSRYSSLRSSREKKELFS